MSLNPEQKVSVNFSDAKDSVGKGHRSGIVYGGKATGKTTLIASASQFAPAKLQPGKIIKCRDVAIIQIDAESTLGALHQGLEPRVIDLSSYTSWESLQGKIAYAVSFLIPLVKAGDVRVVGIDLGIIDAQIRAYSKGVKGGIVDKGTMCIGEDVTKRDKDVNWNTVGSQGLFLYRALSLLECLVIGMCHAKIVNNNPMKAIEDGDASIARDLKSFGGDASKVGPKLSAGVLDPWMANTSFLFAREIKVSRDPKSTPTHPKMIHEYVTHTRDHDIFECGSRAAATLAPTETRTLSAMIKDMYSFGDAA